MNAPAGAGLVQDPNHEKQVLEWLRSVGYDVGAMLPPEMTLPGGGMPGGPPPYGGADVPRPGGGLGAMSDQEMQEMQRRGMPGGNGWDGVNQKLQYLNRMREMQKQRAAQGNLRGSGQGGGMGAMSDAELQALEQQRARVPAGDGAGMFGQLMSMFGNR